MYVWSTNHSTYLLISTKVLTQGTFSKFGDKLPSNNIYVYVQCIWFCKAMTLKNQGHHSKLMVLLDSLTRQQNHHLVFSNSKFMVINFFFLILASIMCLRRSHVHNTQDICKLFFNSPDLTHFVLKSCDTFPISNWNMANNVHGHDLERSRSFINVNKTWSFIEVLLAGFFFNSRATVHWKVTRK